MITFKNSPFQGVIEKGSIMLHKEKEEKSKQIEMIFTDQLVPENHLLRKIDRYVDFEFIYDLVEDLYCLDNGRPSIDPVILFKIVLIQYFFNIKSMRQTIKDIEVNSLSMVFRL